MFFCILPQDIFFVELARTHFIVAYIQHYLLFPSFNRNNYYVSCRNPDSDFSFVIWSTSDLAYFIINAFICGSLCLCQSVCYLSHCGPCFKFFSQSKRQSEGKCVVRFVLFCLTLLLRRIRWVMDRTQCSDCSERELQRFLDTIFWAKKFGRLIMQDLSNACRTVKMTDQIAGLESVGPSHYINYKFTNFINA